MDHHLASPARKKKTIFPFSGERASVNPFRSFLVQSYTCMSVNLKFYTKVRLGPLPMQDELLEPYFLDKGFPQCTMLHYYVSTIKIFAERVCEYALTEDLKELRGWARVRVDAQTFTRWMEEIPARQARRSSKVVEGRRRSWPKVRDLGNI